MRWVFQSFCDAWEFFEKNGLEGRNIHPMWSYSIFGGLPRYWLIDKLELVDPSDRWCGDYFVRFVKKISIKEISQYMQNTE
jgi:REP element-mobilizing transposase RayT